MWLQAYQYICSSISWQSRICTDRLNQKLSSHLDKFSDYFKSKCNMLGISVVQREYDCPLRRCIACMVYNKHCSKISILLTSRTIYWFLSKNRNNWEDQRWHIPCPCNRLLLIQYFQQSLVLLVSWYLRKIERNIKLNLVNRNNHFWMEASLEIKAIGKQQAFVLRNTQHRL
jgi:hypothetical protein